MKGSSMTKLEKVLKFIRQDGKPESKKNYNFTWRQFIKTMKCTYPCTETNYLSMLVNAQYVVKTGRGYYHVAILPGYGMSYSQLKRESSTNWNSDQWQFKTVKEVARVLSRENR